MPKLFELSSKTSRGTLLGNPHMFAASRAGVLRDPSHEAGVGSPILDAAYAGGILTDATMSAGSADELSGRDEEIIDEVIAAMPVTAQPRSEVVVEIPDRIPDDMLQLVKKGLGERALSSVS